MRPVYWLSMTDDALPPDSFPVDPADLRLLTPLARTFLAIAEHPTATLDELSNHVEAGPQRVSRAISSLAKAGLIVRTKVGRRNRYQIVPETVKNHPDIKRLLHILRPTRQRPETR